MTGRTPVKGGCRMLIMGTILRGQSDCFLSWRPVINSYSPHGNVLGRGDSGVIIQSLRPIWGHHEYVDGKPQDKTGDIEQHQSLQSRICEPFRTNHKSSLVRSGVFCAQGGHNVEE
ncbi:hypothetical protein AVEN_133230-1 [Araneus ventricosus]|uniref:Uncharacterized protein n=1 Tax=Araneus ventricosus TaxID=182803 RepID=A0A4Y2J6S1_ARAVE|nr:hypothetical protein AVEN_133230-1 [Araneus ventricosus]